MQAKLTPNNSSSSYTKWKQWCRQTQQKQQQKRLNREVLTAQAAANRMAYRKEAKTSGQNEVC